MQLPIRLLHGSEQQSADLYAGCMHPSVHVRVLESTTSEPATFLGLRACALIHNAVDSSPFV